jgi:hypothetical protein
MWDVTISNVHVQDVAGFDAAGQPTVTKRVTFMVGTQGPFTLTYSQANYSATRVTEDIAKEVETLRAIHDQTMKAS